VKKSDARTTKKMRKMRPISVVGGLTPDIDALPLPDGSLEDVAVVVRFDEMAVSKVVEGNIVESLAVSFCFMKYSTTARAGKGAMVCGRFVFVLG